MAGDLDLVNLNYDYTNFDTQNITSILMNAKSDFALKKSSLEQLILLLFDCQQKRGKALFTNTGVQDVFTFCLQEILTCFKTNKTYMGELVGDLPPEHVQFVEQCIRFLFFSYIFYAEEAPVKTLFDKIRHFSSGKGDSE